jgi:hypothetical protein
LSERKILTEQEALMVLKEDMEFLQELEDAYKAIREGFPDMIQGGFLMIGHFFDTFKGVLAQGKTYTANCTEVWMVEGELWKCDRTDSPRQSNRCGWRKTNLKELGDKYGYDAVCNKFHARVIEELMGTGLLEVGDHGFSSDDEPILEEI